jgi:hypothetical protein
LWNVFLWTGRLFFWKLILWNRYLHGVRLWWFEWGGGQVLRGVREWSLVPLFPLSTYSFTVGACMDSRDRLLHGMGTDDQVWTC